ncbi:MAG: aminoglycoside 6'-N-acetyltransferase [Acutalibacteraceae bacterium]|jgi:aminoglycoside 6'-N-acetyltransferase I
MRTKPEELPSLAKLVKIIWPEHTPAELERIIQNYIDSDNSAVFSEKADGQIVGAALCCLRHDYVEGCETSPVGYLEGVSVKEEYRHKKIAKKLVLECEQWAREKGCTEFASDCELTNTASMHFHLSIGFQEENRIICFKKLL